MIRKIGLLPWCLMLAACGGEPEFTADLVLGGERVAAESLNRGRELYMLNCYACHGENGDGRGPASAYLRPAPRDFRVGVFKFGGVRNPGLPHTQDLVDLVRRGLTGTAMLPWDLPESDLTDIINYIKTFSKQWTQQKKLGERITPTEDPWASPVCYPVRTDRPDPTPADYCKQLAIKRGETVYHIQAQCRTCHPAYVTQEKLWHLSKDVGWGYGDMNYRSQLKDSDAFKGTRILPIDFLYHPLKTINAEDTEEEARQVLYRTIGSGIAGAAMPTWKGVLSEEELWALVYYVQHLGSLRDTPQAYEMRKLLSEQPKFEPPVEAAAPEQAPTQ